tara:strand:+ start:206 stop:385 length:180 start_codon:yes stop_codon:yes gene_type:complete
MEETMEERVERMGREMCWYPLALCHRKANASIVENGLEIGYCKAHAEEMRRRYANWEVK